MEKTKKKLTNEEVHTYLATCDVWKIDIPMVDCWWTGGWCFVVSGACLSRSVSLRCSMRSIKSIENYVPHSNVYTSIFYWLVGLGYCSGTVCISPFFVSPTHTHTDTSSFLSSYPCCCLHMLGHITLIAESTPVHTNAYQKTKKNKKSEKKHARVGLVKAYKQHTWNRNGKNIHPEFSSSVLFCTSCQL